jgi:hypothetical protein
MQALNKLKTYFLRGLATFLPSILAIWNSVKFYQIPQYLENNAYFLRRN